MRQEKVAQEARRAAAAAVAEDAAAAAAAVLMTPDLEGEEAWASFEDYGDALECVPVDRDQEAVMEVAAKLQGGAGPCGVDAIQLKNWLLRYGRES